MSVHDFNASVPVRAGACHERASSVHQACILYSKFELVEGFNSLLSGGKGVFHVRNNVYMGEIRISQYFLLLTKFPRGEDIFSH